MTVRPIIFSGPMVRALLDGRKTQTRRLASSPLAKCEVGDRLYVRETWSFIGRQGIFDLNQARPDTCTPIFRADDVQADRWWPSIHHPRWASRLTLTVREVRRQRLQDLTEDDACAEGAEYDYGQGAKISQRRMFEILWRHLHGESAWDGNPEVVALTFTVERRNVDAQREPAQ